MKHIITAIILLVISAANAAEIKSCVAIKAMEPRLPEGVQRAWGQPSKFFKKDTTVRFRFLAGTAKQKSEAWKRFSQIDSLVNLKFVQVTSGASEVRVRFDRGKGHWSYLGTDARIVPSTAATMNIDLMAGVFGDGSDEWDRVALHECLHAIGLEHEHQHPQSTTKWNREAVYNLYEMQQGWSRAQIDFQVIDRKKVSNFVGTAPDLESIMMYPIPPGLADIVVGWNFKMTQSDIAFLKRIYP